MKRSTQTELAGMAEVFQTLIETFKSVKTVRIFNRERTERRRFKEAAQTLYSMTVKIALHDSLLRPVTEVLSIVSISLSMLVGAYLVLNQERTTFIITHRPSSLKLADRVIVLELGRIVHDSSVSEASTSSDAFQSLFAKAA